MKLFHLSLIRLLSLGIGSAYCNFEDDSEGSSTGPTLTLSLPDEIYDESESLPSTPPMSPPEFSDSASSSAYRGPRPLKRQNAGFWDPKTGTFHS